MVVTPSDIKKDRRTCNEFYSRFVSARLSHYFSALFVNLGVTANGVTTFMLIFGLLFPIMMLSSNIYVRLLGAVGLPLINVMDTSDGEVARFTNTSSELGVYADKVFQLAIDIAIFAVVSVILFQSIHKYYAVPALVLLFLHVMDTVSKEIFVRITSNKQDLVDMKDKITFQKDSVIKYFVHITSSTTSVCHFLWIVILLDHFLFSDSNPVLLASYMTYLAVCQLLKSVMRQRNMLRLLKLPIRSVS